MAKNKLDILLGLDNAQLKTKLKESQGLLKSFKTSLGGVLGGAALGISLKSLGDYALNASKAFESASISFKVLLGDEEKAAKLVKDIEALANVTPMSSSGLQENAKLLLNFNAVAEDEVIPTLTMLGDISGGNEAKMSSLTLAFAQCASAGRLMGQDLLQMINAGFNPLQVMSEKTGKSIAQLKEEMSDGKISVDMVKQAFKDATAEGGRFYGMMKEQSESKQGLESTKADSYEILARTIADRAVPALKELDKAQIKAATSATEHVKTFYAWMDVNNQTLNIIKNTSLALVTFAGVFITTKKSVALASAAIEYFRYQQALARTETTALALAMQGKLVLATKALIVQFRTLTATMLANPWTWVAAAIAGLTAAVFAYKNSLEESGKALDDINAKYDQQTQTIEDNISTINRLAEVKKRSITQEEELNKALDALIKKYPSILGEYDKEILKLQGINSELAKRIYLMNVAEKKEKLLKEKAKTDKKVNEQHSAYVMYNQVGAARYGTPIDTSKGRTGVRKSVQIAQDRINKELKDLENLEKKILNNEISFGTKESGGTRKTSNASTTSEADKKKAKAAAEKARKEALALKLAQLDAELLLVKNNAEEVYKIELQKIQVRLNAAKKGTSEYQTILNDRVKLEQQYNEQVIQLDIERYNRKAELEELQIERQKNELDADNEAGRISNSEYYTKLQELENQKYNIKLQGLNRQAELYKNDVRKLEEINQEKLLLEANYQNEKLRLNTEAVKAETEKFRQLFSEISNSYTDNLGKFLSGNQTLKDSFLNIFDDIKSAFAKMIAQMLVEQAKLQILKGLTAMAGGGGWLGTAANFIKGFFADGGIVPGQYNQAMPIVAHGSEMVLNPLQQKNLWNLIANGNGAQNGQITAKGNQQQPVIVNNITPVFQSLDPSQGQKMFNDWMKQSGIPIVRDSIKNNNYQMRDIVKGVG